MKYFLLAVIPSENIVLRIMELRTLLFRKFGLVSARALPVMIPLSYIHESINNNQFKGLTVQKANCSSVYRASETGDIYLQINNFDFTTDIEKRLRQHN